MSEMTFTGGLPRDRAGTPSAPIADRLPHYISDAPFDPYSVERMTPAQERFYMASEWRMVWWKLRRHRIAVLVRCDPSDYVRIDPDLRGPGSI